MFTRHRSFLGELEVYPDSILRKPLSNDTWGLHLIHIHEAGTTIINCYILLLTYLVYLCLRLTHKTLHRPYFISTQVILGSQYQNNICYFKYVIYLFLSRPHCSCVKRQTIGYFLLTLYYAYMNLGKDPRMSIKCRFVSPSLKSQSQQCDQEVVGGLLLHCRLFN